MGDGITQSVHAGHAAKGGALTHDALVRDELNAVAVQANRAAFEWGRCAAHDLEMVRRIAYPDANRVVELKRIASSLEDIVARRVEFLTGYQNTAYARRYSDLVERVRRVESDRLQSSKITEAVARYYFKLLAYKDEIANLVARSGAARVANSMTIG
jgi:indolepyruvate ferredoxin oxidoreductase